MKTLISIVGPTGIGKTALSLRLAEALGTEIISCDSRQIYREIPIGTAAPTAEELARVRHHFIGEKSVEDYYSVGAYEQEAVARIAQLHAHHEILVMVGGSMMYEKSVIAGLNDLPEANAENQEKLQEIWKEEGLQELQQMLAVADPSYFDIVDRENPRRLLRALDIIWQTGRPYSEIIQEATPQRPFRVIRLGLEAPREVIYDRINRRVLQMMEKGLEQEVRQLVHLPRDLVALNTVGYKEMFQYLDGEISRDAAVELIQQNSRRFAKRQLTWYRKEQDIHWLPYQDAEEGAWQILGKKFGIFGK